MAEIKFHGDAIHTAGSLPRIGEKAPSFSLVKNDLSRVNLESYAGKNIILNIFPSIDTGVCAQSVRQFNQRASELKDTVVLCVSKDLPFAHKRFCGAEGIENVDTLSDMEDMSFTSNYQTQMISGPLKGLHARAIVTINKVGEVVHTELVDEITNEPNYEAALGAF